jgi:hypothetical protein
MATGTSSLGDGVRRRKGRGAPVRAGEHLFVVSSCERNGGGRVLDGVGGLEAVLPGELTPGDPVGTHLEGGRDRSTSQVAALAADEQADTSGVQACSRTPSKQFQNGALDGWKPGAIEQCGHVGCNREAVSQALPVDREVEVVRLGTPRDVLVLDVSPYDRMVQGELRNLLRHDRPPYVCEALGITRAHRQIP